MTLNEYEISVCESVISELKFTAEPQVRYTQTAETFFPDAIRTIRALLASNAELLAALEGVVRVSDRKTDEYDAAHAAIANARRVL